MALNPETVALSLESEARVAELKAAAMFVTDRPGGRGAVREVVERLLRARGGWEAAVAGYGGGVA